MHDLYTKGFTQNRELSWLRFNDRVLSEATDPATPLLEQLKFIAIFSSNLDEFFMIRVGSLFDMAHGDPDAIDNKSGLTPREQLSRIFHAVGPLYQKEEQLYHQVETRLRAYGIYDLSYGELAEKERQCVRAYFKASIQPVLSPQIVDVQHPFPHLANKVNHIGVFLKHKSRNIFGVVPIPGSMPALFYLPGSETRYIRLENIILEYAQQLFDPYVVEEAVVFSVTRNADVNPDDEVFADESDFRKRMKKVLGQRRRLAPVRLELSAAVSPAFQAYFREKLGLSPVQIYVTSAPLKMDYVYGLVSRAGRGSGKGLLYEKFTPQWPAGVHRDESMLKQVERGDILLSYPFESMEPFLRLVKEAAEDPSVISIKITIYRLAHSAKLVDYLCMAAENGKQVTVLIELRARFDEQNNIDWSERLEEAGCTIIYGFEFFKVHSKVCLITRKTRGGIQHITQVGTGNYNENTARLYTDLSLMTAREEIGRDAAEFFKNMSIGNLQGEYKHFLVAPVGLKSAILSLIEGEMAKGREGYIFIKINSLTDADIIDKLSEASCAGVQIHMVVRGICCLLPGIPGKTENIHIRSIVGRYLEHSRIYCFGKGAEERMYIASADFMTRNTERRVEVACPIYDRQVREKIHKIMEAAALDSRKARILMADGSYSPCPASEVPLDSHIYLMEEALRAVRERPDKASGSREKSIFHSLGRLFRRREKRPE